jgi:double-strand break repair protein MRE11
LDNLQNKLTTAKEDSVDQEKVRHQLIYVFNFFIQADKLSNLIVQLQEKESQSKERTSSQNLQTDTLSMFEKQKCLTTTEEKEQQALDSDDDEPIESSVSDIFFSHHKLFKSR